MVEKPSKDQWFAYVAAWLGWTLDAFDFTVFLLIMLPISQYYGIPLTEVTAVFTVTLIMRLLGATTSGWMADRLGRRAPLMISILWYSICNFVAGFSPSFAFLFSSGHCLASEWVLNGRRAPRWPWRVLAGPFARLHVRRAAGVVGHRLRTVVTWPTRSFMSRSNDWVMVMAGGAC